MPVDRPLPDKRIDNQPHPVTQMLFDAAHDGQFKDLDGKPCPKQGQGSMMPILRSGSSDNGCEFASKKEKSFLEFNDIFQQTAKSTVRLEGTGTLKVDVPEVGVAGDAGATQGTAMMVARDGDSCLALTAAHVVTDGDQLHLTNQKAVTIDGQSFPTEVKFSDRPADEAIVSIKMGSQINLCQPIKIAAKQPKIGDDVLSVGFAGDGGNLYASPGKVNNSGSFGNFLNDKTKAKLTQDDLSRTVIQTDARISHGQSGGGIVNLNGELTGINQAGGGLNSIGKPLDVDSINRELNMSKAH